MTLICKWCQWGLYCLLRIVLIQLPTCGTVLSRPVLWMTCHKLQATILHNCDLQIKSTSLSIDTMGAHSLAGSLPFWVNNRSIHCSLNVVKYPFAAVIAIANSHWSYIFSIESKVINRIISWYYSDMIISVVVPLVRRLLENLGRSYNQNQDKWYWRGRSILDIGFVFVSLTARLKLCNLFELIIIIKTIFWREELLSL